MKYIIAIFRYIEPMWLGADGKPSIRRFLALCFSFNMMVNIRHVVRHPSIDNSYADLVLMLGIEAGLIAALLSLTTYSSIVGSKPRQLPEE